MDPGVADPRLELHLPVETAVKPVDLLAEAADLGYNEVLINTNGLLLSANARRRLAASGNVRLSISLQGSRALHDRTRGAGTYHRTRDRIAAESI